MGRGAVGGGGAVSNLGMVDLSGRPKSRDTEVTLVPIACVATCVAMCDTQEFSLNSGPAISWPGDLGTLELDFSYL